MNPEEPTRQTDPQEQPGPRKEKILDEKDFIYEAKGKSPMPLWLFIIIVVGIFSILWAGGNWYLQQMQTKVEENPFLKVTNREMSLFLWQNPEFMRIHSSSKTGYLPGFHSVGRVNPKLESVEEYAVAPPEVIFHYHTWDRLLGDYVFPRPIPRDEFKEFLFSSPEWKPENWPAAPEEYRQLIQEFDLVTDSDLRSLPVTVLPNEVRNAFMGWKNYYREGDRINQVKPTVGELRQLIGRYPNYARNNWRNLYPEYLKTLEDPSADPKLSIPDEELTSFLRVANYNYKQSQEK